MALDNETLKQIVKAVKDSHFENTKDDKKMYSNTLGDIYKKMEDIAVSVGKIQEHEKNVDNYLSMLNSKVATNVKEIDELKKSDNSIKGAISIVSFAVLPLVAIILSLAVWIFNDKIATIEKEFTKLEVKK